MFGPTYSNITAFGDDFLADGFAQLPGINISVGGNASLVKPEVSFNASLNQKYVFAFIFRHIYELFADFTFWWRSSFLYWNVTYVVPHNLSAPTLEIVVVPT